MTSLQSRFARADTLAHGEVFAGGLELRYAAGYATALCSALIWAMFGSCRTIWIERSMSVVFSGEVNRRTSADSRVAALEAQLSGSAGTDSCCRPECGDSARL